MGGATKTGIVKPMMMSLHTRAWYLDKFGIERECVVVKASGLVDGIVAVLDLEGRPVVVDRESLYYVPRHASDTA